MLKILEDLNNRKKEHTVELNSKIESGKYLFLKEDLISITENKELTLEDKLNINKLKKELESKYREDREDIASNLADYDLTKDDFKNLEKEYLEEMKDVISDYSKIYKKSEKYTYIFKENDIYYTITFEAENINRSDIFSILDKSDIDSLKTIYSFQENEITESDYNKYINELAEPKVLVDLRKLGLEVNIKDEEISFSQSNEFKKRTEQNIVNYIKEYYKDKFKDLFVKNDFVTYKGISDNLKEELIEAKYNKMINTFFYNFQPYALKEYIDNRYELNDRKLNYKQQYREIEKEYEYIFKTIEVLMSIPNQILNSDLNNNSLKDIVEKTKDLSSIDKFKKIFENYFESNFDVDNSKLLIQKSNVQKLFIELSKSKELAVEEKNKLYDKKVDKNIDFSSDKNNLPWLSVQSFMYSNYGKNKAFDSELRTANFFENPDRFTDYFKVKASPDSSNKDFYLVNSLHKHIIHNFVENEKTISKDISIEELILNLEKNYSYDFDSKVLLNKEHFILTKLVEVSKNDEEFNLLSSNAGNLLNNAFSYNKEGVVILKEFFTDPKFKQEKEELIDFLMIYFEKFIHIEESKNIKKIIENLNEYEQILKNGLSKYNDIEIDDEDLNLSLD